MNCSIVVYDSCICSVREEAVVLRWKWRWPNCCMPVVSADRCISVGVTQVLLTMIVVVNSVTGRISTLYNSILSPVALFQIVSAPCLLRGVMHPWFDFSFFVLVYFLLACIVASPLILFSSIFPSISPPLLVLSFVNVPAPFPLKCTRRWCCPINLWQFFFNTTCRSALECAHQYYEIFKFYFIPIRFFLVLYTGQLLVHCVPCCSLPDCCKLHCVHCVCILNWMYLRE